jgi:adenylate cyclase
MQGKLVTGRKYAEQLLRLAQSRDDSGSLLQAHYALGMTHYRQGKFVTARAHLEKCQALYDSRQHFSHTLFYGGSDPGVGAHCFMAWTLWYLGYADQALEQGRAAETLAQSLAHPYSQAFALNFVAWVHKLRREVVDTRAHAEAAIALASEHGYSQMVTLGTILRGWALIAQGHTADGLHDLQRGIEDWRATGTEDGRPYFLALLADAYGKVARVADGLSLVNEAIAAVNKNGERVHEAHVYHLKGHLLLVQQGDRQPTKDKSQKSKIGMGNWELGSGPIPAQSPNPQSQILDPNSEAEACFQHALRVARQQKAKALELRATVSLGRLWALTGKQRQARQLLTKICDWFTEAHSTADLREARDLLGRWS